MKNYIYLIILYRGRIFPSTVRSRSITSPFTAHPWFVYGPFVVRSRSITSPFPAQSLFGLYLTHARELQKWLNSRRLWSIGHIVLAVVFNLACWCNSPKASVASKKTLNLPLFPFFSGVLAGWSAVHAVGDLARGVLVLLCFLELWMPVRALFLWSFGWFLAQSFG
jgi:hypothetical protein